jgi:hypothetical protein
MRPMVPETLLAQADPLLSDPVELNESRGAGSEQGTAPARHLGGNALCRSPDPN